MNPFKQRYIQNIKLLSLGGVRRVVLKTGEGVVFDHDSNSYIEPHSINTSSIFNSSITGVREEGLSKRGFLTNYITQHAIPIQPYLPGLTLPNVVCRELSATEYSREHYLLTEPLESQKLLLEEKNKIDIALTNLRAKEEAYKIVEENLSEYSFSGGTGSAKESDLNITFDFPCLSEEEVIIASDRLKRILERLDLDDEVAENLHEKVELLSFYSDTVDLQGLLFCVRNEISSIAFKESRLREKRLLINQKILVHKQRAKLLLAILRTLNCKIINELRLRFWPNPKGTNYPFLTFFKLLFKKIREQYQGGLFENKYNYINATRPWLETSICY